MTTARVYFFSTCLIEHIYPDIGFDAMSVLGLCGYDCAVPLQQTCCGQPAYNSGSINDSRAVAEHTLNIFSEEPLPLIVPSASCADMIKNQYPKLFPYGSLQHEQALDLASRCFEFIDFIAKKLPEPSHELAPKQTMLHVSCSARRGIKVQKSWQLALERAFSLQSSEPEDEQECCGFGGTFSVKSPDISTVMAKDKCDALMAKGDQTFYSGDSGCLMHLNGFAEKQGMQINGKHIISALAARYGVANAK